MGFDYTPAQKQVIENRGALLVSAAAGSGKTAVLVERVIQCMLDPQNPMDIHRLLVLTFTTTAAAEMKERIGARLQQLLADDPTNPRLRKQQMHLAKANISTVDAYCKTLISQYFEHLSCSPDFTILSQTALSALTKQAMEETLNQRLLTHPEEMKQTVNALCPYQGTYGLTNIITHIYEYLRSLPFPSLWIEQTKAHYQSFTTMGASPWGKAIMKRVAGEVDRAITALEKGLNSLQEEPTAQKRYDLLKNGLEHLCKVQTALAQNRWDEVVALCALSPQIKYTADKIDPLWKPLTVQLQATYQGVCDTLADHFSLSEEECAASCRTLAPVISFLLDTVTAFDECLTQKKKAQNAMDFADLEYAALSLLVELKDGKPTPTALSQEIASSFDFVMVDEFQDANDLQTAIYHALSHGGENLFTVGDVKQSIFRFRKANPKNFLRMLDSYPAYDGKCSPGTVILDGNFRSRGEICRTVNHFFSLVMSPAAGEITYDRSHHLIPLKEFPPAAAPVTLAVLETDQRTPIEVEADAIAMEMKKALTTPCVTQEGTLVPATYEDCVILLRSHKTKAPLYVKRLREHGIPAVADSTDGFFNKREIALITALLTCVDNPTDDLAVASVMLSPFFEFSTEELAQLRVKHPKIPLWSALKQEAGEGNPKAEDLTAQIKALRLYGVTHSPTQLLEQIYHTYHALSLVQLWEKGEARKQNLLALLTLAGEWEQNGGEGLGSFLTALSHMKEKEEKEENTFVPSVTLPQGGGVRIMSIHRSKGLQFPLCFVAGCSGAKNNRDTTQSVLLDETLGLGVTLHNPLARTHASTPQKEAIAYQIKQANLSEELRVLYVAMTRAIDRLYLFATYSDPQKQVEKAAMELQGQEDVTKGISPHLVLGAPNFAKLFLYFALLHPSGNPLRVHGNTDCGFLPAREEDFQVTLIEAGQIDPPAPLVPQAESPLRATDTRLLEEIRANLSYENPKKELAGVFAKRSVSSLTHQKADGTSLPRPGFLQEKGLTPAEKGTALHQFMQYAHYPAAAENPEGEIARLVEKGFITPLQGEAINREKLEGFFQSHLYRRMAASPALLREHRFIAALPATLTNPQLDEKWAKEQVVVQGIVDCMFWEKEGFVVVDYKTDRVKTPEELISRYKPQLQLYAKMLKESEGKTVTQLILYSFALNQTVEVPLDCNE